MTLNLIIEQQVQELRLVHRALEAELGKIHRLGREVKAGCTEGEYDAGDLWGRLTGLGQLVSGLEGVEAASKGDEVSLVVAIRAGWECFWELDKVLNGRGLDFVGRKVVFERISGLVAIYNKEGAGEAVLDSYLAKLAD